jgi:BppU N-terminal domain
MDLIKEFRLDLDLVEHLRNPTIQIKESDVNSVRFTFQVLDERISVDLTGAVVKIVVKKPSELIFSQVCTVTDPPNGMCEVVLEQQAYNEKGYYSAELLITKGDITTTTHQFEFSCLNAISDAVIAGNSAHNVQSEQELTIWRGTQAEFEAIELKDTNTLYFTTE